MTYVQYWQCGAVQDARNASHTIHSVETRVEQIQLETQSFVHGCKRQNQTDILLLYKIPCVYRYVINRPIDVLHHLDHHFLQSIGNYSDLRRNMR